MAKPGNDNLRQALANAGISGDELAELINVDTRTVRRWLTGQPPYPRHRIKIARALELTEHDLWPEVAARQTSPGEPAPSGEPITGYPYSDDPSAPSSLALISSATERIDLLDETLHPLLTQPGVPDLLVAKASDGCQIRILVASPADCLRPLLRQPGIQIRALEDIEPLTLHRADQELRATLRLTELLDAPPILLHLKHRAPGGVFDRLTDHYQAIWDTAAGPIQTDQDIDGYLFEDEREHASLHGGAEEPRAQPQQLPAHDDQPQAASQTPAQPPRRWPRRPG